MKIGVSIMDAERNVVYVNKQQKEISGDSIIYGAPCFQSFAPGAVVFCEDCPTTNKDRIVTHARPGGFYDMQCIPLMDGKKIIGHAKLSTEVTEKKRLLNLFGKMPLKDTIEGILEGIRARGFSRVRFYMISEGGKYLIGYCAIGHKDENKGFIGKPIPVSSYQNIKTSLTNGKPQVFIRHGDSDSNWLTFSHKEALNEVGDCPILSKDGKPLGLVAVDNYDEDYPDITRDKIRRLTEESVKRVGAFSGLISTAIETDLTRRKDEIRKILIDSDIEIYKQRSLQDMLQILIEKVIMVIEKYWSYAFGENDPDFIVTGHIMTNRGKWLEKIAGKGILYDNWARNANIDREHRLPRVRVFNDGKDMITDHINKDKLWQELLTELEQENKIDDASLRYMKTLQSLCCILIKFGDEKFGTMTLQSPKPYIFNEYITDIIRGYVSKCCQPLKSLHLVDVEKRLTGSMQGLTKVIGRLLRNRENEERLIWTMLTGLTHHEGLGYNRAVYFDCVNNTQYTGRYAVGPINDDDAMVKYEGLEKLERKPSLDDSIPEAPLSNKALTNHIKGKILDDSYFGSEPKVVDLRDIAFMPSAQEIVTLGLSSEGKNYGALLVDNFVTGIRPSEKDKNILALAGNIFSLVLHNFRYKQHEDTLLSTMIYHRLRTDIAGPFNMIDAALKRNDKDLLDLPLMRDKLYEVLHNTNDLLYYSKFAIHGSSLHPVAKTNFYVEEMISQLVDKFFLQNERFNVDVPHAMMINADKNMLNHALTNLLDNAFKYSKSDTAICVSVRKEDNRVCFLVVSDTKSDIRDLELEKFFDRFHTGPESEGAGIGLYIVKIIAEAHGGGVIARSTEGGKVVFGFIIPE
jgi:signal transduction histidine kinase